MVDYSQYAITEEKDKAVPSAKSTTSATPIDYSQYAITEEKDETVPSVKPPVAKPIPVLTTSATPIDYSQYAITEEKDVKEEPKEESSFIGGIIDDAGDLIEEEFPTLTSLAKAVVSDEEEPSIDNLEDFYATADDPNKGYFAKPKDDTTFLGDLYYSIPAIAGSTAYGIKEFGKSLGELATVGIDKALGTNTRASYINALETAGKFIDETDEELRIKSPSYRSIAEQFQGDRYTELGQELSRLPATFAAIGVGRKTAKKITDKLLEVPEGKVLGKATKRLKKTAEKSGQILGGGGAVLVADVFQRDPDQMYIAEVATDLKKLSGEKPGLLNDALTIIEELNQNPNDTELQKRSKQIKETLLLEGVGQAVVTSLFLPRVISRAIKSVSKTPAAKEEAVKEGITNITNNGKRTRVDGEEIVKDVSEEGDVVYKKRSKVTEAIGKINTAAGRLLRSDAALPKQLSEAAIARSNADKAFVAGVKDNIRQLKKIKKKDNVSDEALSKYINENIDEGLTDSVRAKADQIKGLIVRNEAKINNLLGLEGKDKIGVGFNGDNVYFTRTFEAVNNPAYMKKIKKAMEGSLNKEVKEDADFIAKVTNARKYFRKKGLKGTDDELDAAVVNLVERLSGSGRGFLDNLLEGATDKEMNSLAGQAAKVLKTRKKLDQPVLDLLGEQKDPFAKISATLTNQNKLIAEINYLSEVDNFFRKNMGEEVELGGLIPKLSTARSGVKVGRQGTKESADLYNISEEAIGKFGGKSNLLKNMHVSPQMYNYVNNGLDIFNPRKRQGGIGSAFMRSMAQLSAYGQSTQTVLDLPAYMVNTYGAFQALASNGLLFSPSAYRQAGKATSTFARQLASVRKDNLESKKALQRLEKLKSKGVIDTDLTSEMITQNINVYGKQMGGKFGKLGRAYSKTMEKASTAYGAPDTYSKLLAFEGEFAALGKTFPRGAKETLKDYEDRIFDMAAERVRNTMPSYSVASPLARSLSRLPIGTYALFPSEMVRTTKNTLKYGLKDIKDGLKKDASGKRNARQVAMGLRRLTGLGITATGVDYVVRDNNEQLGVNDTTDRVLSVLSPEWGKNSIRYHTKGLVEGEDGRILTRFINSSSVDAQDYLKVPVRAMIGKLLAGKDVSEFEIKDVMDGMRKSIIGPYTNPKFVTEALIELFQKDFYSDVPEEEGVSLENAKRVLNELQGALQPGTMQVVLKNLESRRSEEKRGKGEGRNEYGFPQTAKDQFTWMTTGVRPVTMDVKKSMGFNLSNDIKGIKSTKDAFIQRLSKIGKDYPFTDKIRTEILKEYNELQGKKFRAMQKLSDKVSLFSDLEYENKDNQTNKFGLSKVLEAATDNFNYNVPDELVYAKAIRNGLGELEGGTFIPDDFSNDARLFNLIQNKSWKNTLIEDLVKESQKYYGRKLKE